MDIDYAKIIETADKRRAVLQELEELLKEAGIQTQKLVEIRDWVSKLDGVFHTLDEEGRKLLPDQIRTALLFLGRDDRPSPRGTRRQPDAQPRRLFIRTGVSR